MMPWPPDRHAAADRDALEQIQQVLRQHREDVFAVIDRITTIVRRAGQPCLPLLPPGHGLTLQVTAPHRCSIELTVGVAGCRIAISPRLDTDDGRTLDIAVNAHGDTDVHVVVDDIPATGRIEPPDGGDRP